MAAHLKVSDYAVRTWLEGREEPPEEVFVASVEIILLAAENTTGPAS